ncbi:MAG: chemotaxis response regulator protein-glutamate methylesterase [Firmicutes bacterium]|jgi:two-component system chemotaxis response regulator CheB|nr:chemotaxis response regulator protein-glutamate methylesterase [Bacillota bacterium]
MPRISVLVVDDSAFMRKVISEILSSDPAIEIMGTARDGRDAIAKAQHNRPDVVTLDVEMPVMDGIAALPILCGELGIPVVMLSSQTQAGADVTIRALSLGAVDFVRKPSGSISLDIAKVHDELIAKVKMASRVARGRIMEMAAGWPRGPKPGLLSMRQAQPSGRAGTALGAPPERAGCVVVIGTSTGGPRALAEVIPALPPNLPAGVLVVQHMPAGFTRSLAERLNETSRLCVAEARGGERVTAGSAYLAPGGRHLLVNGDATLALDEGPAVHGVRPAVDVTMRAAASVFGRNTVGVIMTGMGSDGAEAMEYIKQMGGTTICEHESSCVVYGMPRSVAEKGAADRVVPLGQIADEIVDAVLTLA